MSCVEGQIGDLCNVDTHELGEAIDMIKDLEQAMYYHSVVEAMEKNAEGSSRYYTIPYYLMEYDDYYYPERDMDKKHGRMYYGGDRSTYEKEVNLDHMHDAREGRSPMTRRMYMESKELHKDKTHKVKELEQYMQELTEDIIEMIDGASVEERQVLEKKLSGLTNKVAQLNAN